MWVWDLELWCVGAMTGGDSCTSSLVYRQCWVVLECDDYMSNVLDSVHGASSLSLHMRLCTPMICPPCAREHAFVLQHFCASRHALLWSLWHMMAFLTDAPFHSRVCVCLDDLISQTYMSPSTQLFTMPSLGVHASPMCKHSFL